MNERPSRLVLLEAGLLATAASLAFVTVVAAMRQLAGEPKGAVLGGCAVLAPALASVRMLRNSPTIGSSAPLLVGMLGGIALALGGADSHLLFLPVVVQLIALGAIARPMLLLAATVMSAAGELIPAWHASQGSGRLALAALGILVLPWAARAALPWLVARRGDALEAMVPVASIPPELAPGAAVLTPREFEVLTLLASGLRQREVADRLDLTIHQVGHLLRQARERTGTHTTRELIARLAHRPLTGDR